ncbi:MAG: hypothetical protein ABI577_17540, partial [bacterium]
GAGVEVAVGSGVGVLGAGVEVAVGSAVGVLVGGGVRVAVGSGVGVTVLGSVDPQKMILEMSGEFPPLFSGKVFFVNVPARTGGLYSVVTVPVPPLSVTRFTGEVDVQLPLAAVPDTNTMDSFPWGFSNRYDPFFHSNFARSVVPDGHSLGVVPTQFQGLPNLTMSSQRITKTRRKKNSTRKAPERGAMSATRHLLSIAVVAA